MKNTAWKVSKYVAFSGPYEHRKIFKVCLAILQHYAWKG